MKRHPLLPWGLFAAAALLPLTWSRLFVAEYTLPRLTVLSVAILISAVGALLTLRRGAVISKHSELDRAVLLGLAALAVCAGLSQDTLLSIQGRYNSYAYGLWAFLLYGALYFLSSWLQSEDRRKLLGFSLLSGFVVAFYGCLQAIGIEPFTLSAALPSGRAVSTLGSPVDLGAFLGVLAPAALYIKMTRKVSWIGVALILAGLAATASRGAFLSAAVGCAAYLALRPGKTRWGLKSLLVLVAAGAIAAGVLSFKMANRPTSQSDNLRIEAWKAAVSAFRSRPAVGIGPETYGQFFRQNKTPEFVRASGTTIQHAHAHNDLLHAMATTGALGTGAYLWLLWVLVVASRRALGLSGHPEQAAALCGGLAALFVGMKFNPVSIEVLALGALFMGILSASDPQRRRGARGTSIAMASALIILGAASSWASIALSIVDARVQSAREQMGLGQHAAAVSLLRRAVSGNPCEITYQILLANETVELVRRVPVRLERVEMLAHAQGAVEAAVSCHPLDVNGHYILGYISLVQAQVGLSARLEVAAQELDRAISLDSTFAPILSLRLDVARLMGDSAAVKRLLQRMSEITKPVSFKIQLNNGEKR